MNQQISIADNEFVVFGVDILDLGGNSIPGASQLPAGWTLTFATSDATICPITVLPDGLHCEVHTGLEGQATVTITPNGFPSSFEVQGLDVTVGASAPGSMNATVGAPQVEA